MTIFLLEETLKEQCNFETVRTIHEKIPEEMKEQENQENSAPVTLNRNEVKKILEHAANTDIEDFDQAFEESVGESSELLASNKNTRSYNQSCP